MQKNTTLLRLVWICTIGALIGIVLISLNPVNSKLLKLGILGSLFGFWIGCTFLTWKVKTIRLILLFSPLLLAILMLLPGRGIDPELLRADYLRRMNELEGTKYFWGGESSRGIDCSGLPRRALRDSLLVSGLKSFNGRAFRGYAEQWWFDASAKALSEGYRGYTEPVGVTGKIQEMDCSKLLPGDLAVTSNGVHVLVYIGEGKWIQADPGIGAVATLNGKTADNTWFRVPVAIHRWKYFADQ